MNRRELLRSGLLAGLFLCSGLTSSFIPRLYSRNNMKLTLIRHATLLVELAGKKILVDPMLSNKGAMEPVQQASNQLRIPMTSLPLGEEALAALLNQIDAVIVTHTHRDHWDGEAQQLIPKNKLLYCQPADEDKIRAQGFTQVQPIDGNYIWDNITISRTGGQHGTGEIGNKMGPVSGFVLQAPAHSLYIAGDTIWCTEVEKALATYKPTVTVVNAGAAQFLQGDPITMTAEDVQQVILALPDTQVVAVHMDTVNHCHLTRYRLSSFLKKMNLTRKCLVPADGETLSF